MMRRTISCTLANDASLHYIALIKTTLILISLEHNQASALQTLCFYKICMHLNVYLFFHNEKPSMRDHKALEREF